MIITIDGPIATGKSSIAKRLAERLGFIFFDTGAMYRCLTYALLHKKVKVDIENPKELKDALEGFSFDMKIYRGEKTYFVDGEDVTEKIRGEEVTGAVSRVSALAAVREKLLVLQRQMAKGVNAVFEGRDMGTVVFPEADAKVFLIGRPEVRAKRRFDELRVRFPEDTKDLTIEKTLEQVNQRDEYDSKRELSPLRQPEDAFVVDTSDLSVEEIVFKILEYIDTLPG